MEDIEQDVQQPLLSVQLTGLQASAHFEGWGDEEREDDDGRLPVTACYKSSGTLSLRTDDLQPVRLDGLHSCG